ncbi:hypothetical protein C0993_011428 [Termitomyces sp. T159_Od127]|nr:hypothetical protein C0993_011428 [Termitomyces sp. T159_Od127]
MSTTKSLQAEIGMLVKLLNLFYAGLMGLSAHKGIYFLLLVRHKSEYLQHMNHGSEFQALWKQLRAEVHSGCLFYTDLRGYWSSGTRLGDSVKVSGQGIGLGDLPEYLCGGAQTRRRPEATKTRRSRKPGNVNITPSNTTGRQTAKPRKAGSRILGKSVFLGQGTNLLGDEVVGKAKGTGFGKRANSSVTSSKRAREEHALAVERRLLALQNQTKSLSSSNTTDHISEQESDSDHEEVEIVSPETDNDRREALLRTNKNEDLEQLKSGNLWESFVHDFVFDEPQKHSLQVTSSVCGLGVASGSTASISSKVKGKRKEPDSEKNDIGQF